MRAKEPRAAGSLLPLLAAEFAITLANGAEFTVVAARMLQAGLDPAVAGAVGSAFYAGLFSAYLMAPRLLGRLGLRAVRLAPPLCLLGAAALLSAHPVAWGLGRALTGVGVGLLYVCCEAWIVSAVPADRRGGELALYMAVFFGACLVAQAFLLVVPPTATIALGAVGAALVLAFLCLAAIRPPTLPPSGREAAGAALAVMRAAPLAVAGAAVTGLAASAFFALAPVHAGEIGFAPDRVAALPLAALSAATLAQYGLGALSGRLGLRGLLLALCVSSVAASCALAAAAGPGPTLLGLAALWGASALTGYAFASALAYNAPHGRPAAEVARVVLVANGLGGVAGPGLAAAIGAALGPGTGFPVLAALVYAGLALFLLASLGRKTAVKSGSAA